MIIQIVILLDSAQGSSIQYVQKIFRKKKQLLPPGIHKYVYLNMKWQFLDIKLKFLYYICNLSSTVKNLNYPTNFLLVSNINIDLIQKFHMSKLTLILRYFFLFIELAYLFLVEICLNFFFRNLCHSLTSLFCYVIIYHTIKIKAENIKTSFSKFKLSSFLVNEHQEFKWEWLWLQSQISSLLEILAIRKAYFHSSSTFLYSLIHSQPEWPCYFVRFLSS